MRILAVLGFGLVSFGHAATVWSNGSPDQQGVVFSDQDGGTIAEDDFSTSSAATATSLTWWGGYGFGNNPSTDSFTIEIRDASSLILSQAVTAVRSSTAFVVAGLDVYVYDATIADTALAGGSTYFLRIYNNTSGNALSNWFWATSNTSGNVLRYAWPSGSLLGTTGVDVAFQVNGTSVPEPATYLLSALGLTAIYLARRRA